VHGLAVIIMVGDVAKTLLIGGAASHASLD